MNIAFVNDIAILGGGEIWVLNMAAALQKRGHHVSILCPHRSEFFYAALDAGFDLFGYSFGQGTPFHESILQFLLSRKVDVLYCTVLGRFCEARHLSEMVERIPGCGLYLKTGLPPATSLSPEYYGFDCNSRSLALHVVSEENRQQFLDWQPGADYYIKVMREGVDVSRFQLDPELRKTTRSAWGIHDDETLLLNTSRLHPSKGQDNLLLAFYEVVRAGRNVRLIFAGSGGEQDRLQALCSHLRITDRVSFAGHVSDIRPLLSAADLFCHPSLIDGLPNSVAEAMAMSLPVIASNTGGIPELIEDGVNGLLIPKHDIRALEKAVVRLLDDPDLRFSLASQARLAIRKFDFESNVDKWLEAVQDTTPVGVRSRTAGQSLPVLFLMTHFRTGGEETEVSLLSKFLDRSRYPLSVVSTYASNEPSPAADRLLQMGISIDKGCHETEDKVSYLLAKIRKERIRIVVACQDTTLAYQLFARLDQAECRLIEHAGIAQEVFRIPKDYTAALVGVSEDIISQAAPLFTSENSARYLPSMVDTSAFRRNIRNELRKAYGFDGWKVVVFVGRLDRKKGIHHLCEAARVLLPEFPRLRFVIAGPLDAYQEAYGRHLIREAHSEFGTDRFVFAGARDDVPDLLCAADLLVLPSTGEGMSHVINEAGAACLPVIAFADGAAPEQLEAGRAGYLVPTGNVAALTASMREALQDETRAAMLASNLNRKVQRDYAAEVIVPKWRALFEQVAVGLTQVPSAPTLRLVPPDRLMPFPAEIQVETNTACNATCIMCPYPEVSKELPPGRMDLALYEKILEECSTQETLQRLEPFLNNEPFTDTRMVDWISLAKRRVPHALLTVTTNGSLLTPKVTDRLVQSGLDGIWFSFNGSTKETYEKIMGLSFDTVKRNIDYLLDRKPASLRVFTNMIETEPMRGEIAENIQYWQSRGVQSGSSPLVNRAGNVTNFVELNYKKHAERPVRLCELIYHKMYIAYNGDVLLCCMDWRRKIVLGNVRTHTLSEVWNGKPYREYRRQQELGKSRELALCGTCSYICA